MQIPSLQASASKHQCEKSVTLQFSSARLQEPHPHRVPGTSRSSPFLSLSPSSCPSAFCWVCCRLSLWQTSNACPTVRTMRMAWLCGGQGKEQHHLSWAVPAHCPPQLAAALRGLWVQPQAPELRLPQGPVPVVTPLHGEMRIPAPLPSSWI